MAGYNLYPTTSASRVMGYGVMGDYADPQGICACLIPHTSQPFSSCLELPVCACVNSQDPAPPGFPPVSTGGRMGTIATSSIADQPKYPHVSSLLLKMEAL